MRLPNHVVYRKPQRVTGIATSMLQSMKVPIGISNGEATLAVILMQIRKFNKEDFAFYHPGGSLGKRLLTYVRDVMKSAKDCCAVQPTTTILDVLFAMTSSKTGAASVINKQQKLIGIVTDGDIRRYVMYNNLHLTDPISEVMTHSPEWVFENELVEVALRKMQQKRPSSVTALPVVDRERKVCGMLNISDLMNQGFL
ncbi:CBS domain-containing protein [Klebsiella indica]|uniref:CBS domain-containing protein n=2 Tax=Klebsiella/Raoultella group TaxID=2890311 RepID=A0A5R9L8T6_9ENTR|nr:CBS domain-containing protein [Klebsiella indica]